MYCHNCGSTVPENSAYCSRCGCPLTAGYEPPQYDAMQYASQPEAYPPAPAGKSRIWPLIATSAAILVASGAAIWYLLFQIPAISAIRPVSISEIGSSFAGSPSAAPDTRPDQPGAQDSSEPLASATPTPGTPTPEMSATPLPYGDAEYIYPSDRMLFTNEFLSTLTKDSAAFARNEIFARHGYIFKDDKFKEYFMSRSWYAPSERYSVDDLNYIEKENVNLIVNYETSMGWR